LVRFVSDRIRYTDDVLTPKAKFSIQFRISRREHTAVSGCKKLAGMKREASHIAMRPADFFPVSVPANFASNSAGGIFDDRQRIAPSNTCNCLYIAGHAHLVDTKDRTRAFRDHVLDQCRINIES